MKESKHVIRVFLLLILATVGFAIVRAAYLKIVLEPDEYGKFGPYRYANVKTQMDIEPQHYGAEACGECHDDYYGEWKDAAHSSVNCENCHAPYMIHVRDGDRYAAMPVVKSYELCMRCHRQIEARRDSFPQQEIVRHLSEYGEAPSETVCFKCHDPHNPSPDVSVAEAEDSGESEE